MGKEACWYGKKGLLVWEKRLIGMGKKAQVSQRPIIDVGIDIDIDIHTFENACLQRE